MKWDQRIELARLMANELAEDGRAQSTSLAMVVVGLVVGLFVAALMGALVLPVGVDEINNVSTSAWSSGATSLWDTLDIIIILALFLFFIGLALSAARRV